MVTDFTKYLAKRYQIYFSHNTSTYFMNKNRYASSVSSDQFVGRVKYHWTLVELSMKLNLSLPWRTCQ